MMPPVVTFEQGGIVYEVLDWKYVGVRRKRVPLNSRSAEGRAFVPRDHSAPVRIYHFRGGINYQTSDPETLTAQFGYATATTWKP